MTAEQQSLLETLVKTVDDMASTGGHTEEVESMLRHLVDLAKDYDHCGLMGFAMFKAHQIGLKLHALGGDQGSSASREGGEALAALKTTSTRQHVLPPRMQASMASTQTPCVLRFMSSKRPYYTPNSLWSEQVCSEVELNTWKIFPAMLNYIRKSDWPRFIAFVRRGLSSHSSLSTDGAVNVSESQPIGLYIRMPSSDGGNNCEYVQHTVSLYSTRTDEGVLDMLCFEPLGLLAGEAAGSSGSEATAVSEPPSPDRSALPQAEAASFVAPSCVVGAAPVPAQAKSWLMLPQFAWPWRMPCAVATSTATAAPMPTPTPTPTPTVVTPIAHVLEQRPIENNAAVSTAQVGVGMGARGGAEGHVTGDIDDALDWESVERLLM